MIILNPLKGLTEYGWHYEQNVYLPYGGVRSIKASEGSGNIPKVIIKVTNNERVRRH